MRLDEVSVRPRCVVLICLLQFLKAAFLLFVVLLARMRPAALHRSGSLVGALVYISAQSNPRGVLIPIVAVFIAVVAWGLWSLKKWARNLVLVSTGMTIALWLRAFLFYGILHKSIFRSEFQRQMVYLVLLTDAVVFIYLWGVPEAFGERESD